MFDKMIEAGHTPEALMNQPQLPFHLQWYFDAFFVLSQSRSYGFAVGPIPLTEIESYMRIFEIESLEDRMEFVVYIQFMDSEFLDFHNKSSRKPKKGK